MPYSQRDYTYNNGEVSHLEEYRLSQKNEFYLSFSFSEDYEYSPEGFIVKYVKTESDKTTETIEITRTKNFDYAYDCSDTDW